MEEEDHVTHVVEPLQAWSNDVWTVYTLEAADRGKMRCLVLADSHEQWVPGEVRSLELTYILTHCKQIA